MYSFFQKKGSDFYDDWILTFATRSVITAPDEDREKVLKACRMEQFKDLEAMFFSYSAIEELYSLCERRKITGVNDNFLDCFMVSSN